MGSPPRVWGILQSGPVARLGTSPKCGMVWSVERQALADQPWDWNIRTRMSWRSFDCYFSGIWDHPHVCGEYRQLVRAGEPVRGSPPRVWGIPDEGIRGDRHDGITPTCVGNTRVWSRGLCRRQDHPHVCGEYRPPHARARTQDRRITPTCVGNTTRRGSSPAGRKDHPHVCGEYVEPELVGDAGVGSPPRVWGIPPCRGAGRGPAGITPTCVGNTMP